MVLAAVKAHTQAQAAQVLADAGYRSEAVMAQLAITQPDTELVIFSTPATNALMVAHNYQLLSFRFRAV